MLSLLRRSSLVLLALALPLLVSACSPHRERCALLRPHAGAALPDYDAERVARLIGADVRCLRVRQYTFPGREGAETELVLQLVLEVPVGLTDDDLKRRLLAYPDVEIVEVWDAAQE